MATAVSFQVQGRRDEHSVEFQEEFKEHPRAATPVFLYPQGSIDEVSSPPLMASLAVF